MLDHNSFTALLKKNKLCKSISCPILVLTNILGRPRQNDAKTRFKKLSSANYVQRKCGSKMPKFPLRFF